MAARLNDRAFEYAKQLISEDQFVHDDRDAWSAHRPAAADENRFIEKYGFEKYALWHLGIDDEQNDDTKAHFKFPYGDFRKVHRCALLAAETRAGQNEYYEIELAVAHLHGMLDALHRAAHAHR
jgi:hypothetical protein